MTLWNNLQELKCADLNINDDTLGLSMASSIVSQPESSSQDHSIDDKSLQISRTIQQQIDVLVEKAKSNLQSEQMKKKLHELRAENIGLKSELLVQVSSESMRVDSAIEDSNEVSRLQEENEFLGRQLGIVQNKLDQAQEKLRDECQKSESLQMHLELSAETYKQLVEPLERLFFLFLMLLLGSMTSKSLDIIRCKKMGNVRQ